MIAAVIVLRLGRDDVIYLAFAVILATLVGQGLTLPFLATRFRPPAEVGGRPTSSSGCGTGAGRAARTPR